MGTSEDELEIQALKTWLNLRQGKDEGKRFQGSGQRVIPKIVKNLKFTGTHNFHLIRV